MNNDLISREALLKAMEEERQYLLARGQTGAEHILVHHCLPLIDNAPTVEPEKAKESEIIKAYTKGFDTGVETVKSERPQGEWIFKHNSSDVWCSICDISLESNLCEGIKFRYCPNCGADMRKGGAE